MRCSDHNNKNHVHDGGTHDAQWVVDPVLARDMAAEVENCVNSRTNKAVGEALTKAAPQAELETVSFVLPQCDILLSDSHLGKEGLYHRRRRRQEVGRLPRIAHSPTRGLQLSPGTDLL
jgi:hypothetical protein